MVDNFCVRQRPNRMYNYIVILCQTDFNKCIFKKQKQSENNIFPFVSICYHFSAKQSKSNALKNGLRENS